MKITNSFEDLAENKYYKIQQEKVNTPYLSVVGRPVHLNWFRQSSSGISAL